MAYAEDYVCDVCGLLYDKDLHSDVIEHRRVHDLRVKGPKIKLPDGIHIILPKSPRRQRIAAQEAAGLVSREARFLLSYYADSDGDFREYKKPLPFRCFSRSCFFPRLVPAKTKSPRRNVSKWAWS